MSKDFEQQIAAAQSFSPQPRFTRREVLGLLGTGVAGTAILASGLYIDSMAEGAKIAYTEKAMTIQLQVKDPLEAKKQVEELSRDYARASYWRERLRSWLPIGGGFTVVGSGAVALMKAIF